MRLRGTTLEGPRHSLKVQVRIPDLDAGEGLENCCSAPSRCSLPADLKGYLAHKKPPPPQDHHRPLGIVLLQGPRGLHFFMSEVPL